MNRREFAAGLIAGAGLMAPALRAEAEQTVELPIDAKAGSITDVQGIRVGHYTDTRRPTGCTVLLLDPGTVAGVDVRGGAAGTYGTEGLGLIHPDEDLQALFLSGGSGYGLDVASGLLRYFEERGQGVHLAGATIPLIAGAILFDLELGDWKIHPDAEAGYKAALAATTDPVAEGNIGAGAGASVGKLFGMDRAMKTGLGTASKRIGNTDIWVGAIVAVNAVGDVYNPKTGQIVAGALNDHHTGFHNTMKQIENGFGLELAPQAHTNTTIGIVATNAKLSRVQITKVAQMAHDGMARSINPVHTLWDGDTIFGAATGKSATHVNHNALGAVAAEVMAEAIVRGATQAQSAAGLTAYRDLKR